MNYIEIVIKNIKIETKVIIDPNKMIVNINNNEFNLTIDKYKELLRVIRTWKPNYSNSQIIDGESFFIKIDSSDEIKKIKGQGEYPTNYLVLKDWISEFYGK